LLSHGRVPIQFTVRLKNEPGALARLAAQLADHGIDIRTIAAGGVGTFGCAVLSTNDDPAAREVLQRARYTFVEGEPLRVGVEDRPGALANLTRRLADAGVNILGVVILGRHQGKAELAITVDALPVAQRVLASTHVPAAINAQP
jgi:hypothetical protein